jgi:hypothetical protein
MSKSTNVKRKLNFLLAFSSAASDKGAVGVVQVQGCKQMFVLWKNI